jgi:hypothetical protein
MSEPLTPDGSLPPPRPSPPAPLARSPHLPPPEQPRPAPPPAAAPAPAPAPAAAVPEPDPVAPGYGELLERAVPALFLGRAGYAPLADRPEPSYGAMTLLALTLATVGFALNTATTAISQPELLGHYPPWFYAAAVVGVQLLTLGALLLGAGVLWGLGKLLGGEGGFSRAYLAAAMLFALAPLQALTGLFPYAWLLPCVLFAWAGAGAVSGLLRAGFPGALTACTLLASLLLALQAVSRAAYAKSQEALAQAQSVLAAAQAAQTAAALMTPPPAEPSAGSPEPLAPGSGPVDPNAPVVGRFAPAAAGTTGSSSLDLLRAPGEGPVPGAAPSPAEQSRALAQSGELRTQVVAMLESVMPMVDNPAISRGLDAQGKADVLELRQMLAKLKDQTSRNVKLSDQEFDAAMQKIQKMSLRLMSAGMGAAPAVPPPAPAGKKR